MINFQKKTLSNGLKIITAPMKETQAVAVLILASTGSRYENPDKQGLAHFLEHMFFKGTQKRPTTLDISRQLDGVGAYYNAFTGEEQTGLWVKAPFEHFELALDILFDLIYNSKFDSAEVEKEKKVIFEEINMIQDTPQNYILELAKNLFYGNSPLGWQISGTKETVATIQQQNLISFRDFFYTPDEMIIAVAGRQGKSNWLEKIAQYFSKIQTKTKKKLEKIVEKQQRPACKVHFKKTDQAHLVLGFRGIARTDSRRPTLKVLNNILGDTMSSYLFTEVREKRGLAYYISSDYWDFIETGAIGAGAGVDMSKVQEAIKVILEQFLRFTKEKISKDEIDKAKENLKGRLYLGLEDCQSVAEFLADQEMFWGKIEQPEEVVEKIRQVQADDIMRLAKELFRSERLNLAIIGPFEEKKEFNKILTNYE